MLASTHKVNPKINWKTDFCTDAVRSTCPEIGISVAIVLSTAVFTWALTTMRGRAIGVFVGEVPSTQYAYNPTTEVMM